jgi:hypothetical protein
MENMWKQERGHNRSWRKFSNEVLRRDCLADPGIDVMIEECILKK